MGAESELVDAFERVRRALLANDATALGHLVAEDYRGFDPSGQRHDRNLLLEAYGPGGVRLETYDTMDVETRVIGDVGLVMGLGSLRGGYGDQVFEHSLRFLDVYVRRDAKWRLYVSQVTEVDGGP